MSEFFEDIIENVYDVIDRVKTNPKKPYDPPEQSQALYGLFTALCVSTLDPFLSNNVKFFSPFLHEPNTPIDSLPYAFPCSPFGGFDDCGLTWIPPVGSTLCIMFANGDKDSPFYIGTTWHRNNGKTTSKGDINPGWKTSIPEYQIHAGHRTGYLVGKNDGTQCLPPWNTENYNGNDIDSTVDFSKDPASQQKLTYANIYGMKTPQKHLLKFVDGNYKCNYTDKRIELQSSLGNIILLKDDYNHVSGHWGHPNSCKPATSSPSSSDLPTEDCEQEKLECKKPDSQPCKNPHFKHDNESRGIRGPGTPQNNKYSLDQSGIQFLTRGGHTFGMDDSVEEPYGKPEWEEVLQNFSFGCTNLFTGKTFWVSATGHRIEMNDKEEKSELRGEDNYIRIISASGNKIELNDHTTGKKDSPGCGPNLGGKKRGITLQSTSNHTIEMIDEDNEQCSPARKEGGQPTPKAKKAFVRIRSGYGLEIALNDCQPSSDGNTVNGSQTETVNQNIQIFVPQGDNERGPHIMRFQAAATEPGSVEMIVGGNYMCVTSDRYYLTVGSEERPSDLVMISSQNTVQESKEAYINQAKQQLIIGKEFVLIMGGQDCPPPPLSENPDNVPCLGQVLVYQGGQIKISDRVYASASPQAPQAPVYAMSFGDLGNT